MSSSNRYLQFQSPFQGRKGFTLYEESPRDGRLEAVKHRKTHKVMRKGQKNIEGLLLFPAWPTRRGLCAEWTDEAITLYIIKQGIVDRSTPIQVSDPNFSASISERGLYRTFRFSNGEQTFTFRDFTGRLISPQRTAYEIYPPNDFSPFARLIRVTQRPEALAKLRLDMERGYFDYGRWAAEKHPDQSEQYA